MHYLRLSCTALWVDVRVAGMNGRWLASADTPVGPSIGLGFGAPGTTTTPVAWSVP
jgi:hypothetical protein